MATTKIWDVRAHVGKLIAYVTNRDKTTMAAEISGNGKEMHLVAEVMLTLLEGAIRYELDNHHNPCSTKYPLRNTVAFRALRATHTDRYDTYC